MASHDDAMLLIQMMRWSTEMGLDGALKKVFSDAFDPDAVAIDDPMADRLLTLGEALGAFVKHGVLDPTLVKDLWPVAPLWAHLGPAVRRARESLGEPGIYENFEALAKGPM